MLDINIPAQCKNMFLYYLSHIILIGWNVGCGQKRHEARNDVKIMFSAHYTNIYKMYDQRRQHPMSFSEYKCQIGADTPFESYEL